MYNSPLHGFFVIEKSQFSHHLVVEKTDSFLYVIVLDTQCFNFTKSEDIEEQLKK